MIEVSRSKYWSAGFVLTVTWPEPAESQTRAMAVLRLPVAYVRVEAVLLIFSLAAYLMVSGWGFWAACGWSGVA